MSDREKSEKGDEEAKETDTRTESTSMAETEGQDTDMGTSESDWRHERYQRSSGEKKENATQTRDQSSEYHPVRRGVEDCHYYLTNGGCFFGRSCRFNHPPRTDDTVQQPSAYPVRPGARNCIRYLQTGQCIHGSKCWFNHPPVRREMVRGSPYPVHLGARDCEQYLNTGQCSYGRKCRLNHPPSAHVAPGLPGQNSWLQRRRAQWNVQRGNNDCGKRIESEEERTLRERQAQDLEEHKQRERVEEKSRTEQIKATVQSDEGGIQTEQRLEIPAYHSVNGQENLQEQADMERQKREAQER